MQQKRLAFDEVTGKRTFEILWAGLLLSNPAAARNLETMRRELSIVQALESISEVDEEELRKNPQRPFTPRSLTRIPCSLVLDARDVDLLSTYVQTVPWAVPTVRDVVATLDWLRDAPAAPGLVEAPRAAQGI